RPLAHTGCDPQGGWGADLAVEPLTGAGGSSWYPRFGTRLLSGSTSLAPTKPQVRGGLSLQAAVCWGHGDVREVRGATGGGRPRTHAPLLLNPLPCRRTPRTSPPAA